MPEEDTAMISGTLYLPVGTRVEETARVLEIIEKVLREEVPETERESIFTRCGVSEGMSPFGDEGAHIGSFTIKLVPKVERKRVVKEIGAAVRKRLEELKGPLRIEKYSISLSDIMSAGRTITQ